MERRSRVKAEKACETCVFHHPERRTRNCSVFRQSAYLKIRENSRSCAGYIHAQEQEEGETDGHDRKGAGGRTQ